MAKTRDASLLDDLERLTNDQLEVIIDTSKKIIQFRNEENKKLNSINMPSLTRLNTPLYSLFTPANNHDDEKKAAELLGYVKKANYDAIEKMLDKNPTLMFMQVKDADNKNISPLEFAFKVYDTYTWKMLYEKIQDNPVLVEKFTEQAHQQKEHINLKPLFDAYAAYDAQAELWFKEKITDKQMDEHWHELGKKQRELLPAHMLREFCREGSDSWVKKKSAFDAIKMQAPRGGCIFIYSSGADVSLDDYVSSSSVFDSSYALRRGSHDRAKMMHLAERSWYMARYRGAAAVAFDSVMFSRLYEVRKDDLAKQIKLLDQSLAQSPTCKK